MLRRVLFTIAMIALGLAGAASATLAGRAATTPVTTAPVTTTLTVPLNGVAATTTTTTTAHTTTAAAATTRAVTTTGATTSTQATTTTTTTSAIATSDSASTLIVNGHGWGHAMGMAQWGADGYAQHGWTYTQILAHYYQGTTIAKGPSPTVRVLLASGRKKVTLQASTAWTVRDAAGTQVQLPAGSLVVPASLLVDGQTLVSPLTFSAPQPLEFAGRHYRGKLVVVSTGKMMQLVNAVGLESYVKGVVGMEMPSTWPAAALETQAVAARSYALAELESVVTANPFDLYDDTRSQVYGGIEGESPVVTSAVQATAKQVVMYDGKVATTYFSSSSGGRTVSAQEATGTAVPYLVSVDDPYDTLSPYHDWGPVLFNARKVGQLLEASGDLLDLALTPGPSGHVESVSVVGSDGTTTVTGNQVREALGLRSTWFSVAWLSLAKPAAPLVYGKSLTLAGNARGIEDVSLEAKPAGGAWTPAGSVTPDSAGDFSVAVEPQATTQYRLAAGNIRAAVVKVSVTPAVQATLATNTVQGTLRPALGGAACQLQRESGSAWTTVATATTDTSGAFAVSAALSTGSYRVRCAPGHGLSPGLSSPLAQP